MIAALGGVTLKSGERMSIRLIEPPQPEYAERLCHFLEHKQPSAFRGIKQRIEGKYIQHCLDRYFVGEIAGQIVGQVWYGLPRGGTGVGNFGHVYTEPSQRRKGIATELVKVTLDDFMRMEGGVCLLCGAGQNAAPVYRQFGFEFIHPGATSGPMALIKRSVASSFAELDARYFAPGSAVTVREGTIRDRHDCDRMLDFSKGMNELRKRWHAAFVASQVPSFIDALFCVEDGKGIATVLQNTQGSILGYAFVLSLGSTFERDFRVMDFMLHPNYLDKAAFFAAETTKLAQRLGIAGIHAFVALCDKEKLAALLDAGFNEEHRFVGKFRLDGTCHDIAVLRFK